MHPHMGCMKHSAPTPAERATEILITLRANDQHDAQLLAEQLVLEAEGVHAEAVPPPETAVQSSARRWLNGFASAPEELAGPRLYQIQVDRAGIKAAEAELQRQLFAAQAESYRDWLVACSPRWNTITKRRCRALLDLRRANRDAEQFRTEAAAVAPGGVSLPCDRVSGIFGAPIVGDQIYSFLETCVKVGILDRKDVDNAS